MRLTDIERFNNKIRVSETGCHEWTGSLNPKGYGQFKSESYKSWQAHRWIFHHLNPGTPIELYILHTCDNRKCVNIQHLYAGTQADNMRDMYERGRSNHQKGEVHCHAVFTEQEVSRIKGLSAIGLQSQLLAEIFNSNISTIWGIIRGKSWGHVPTPAIIGSPTRTPAKRCYPRTTTQKAINMLDQQGKFINRDVTGFREVISGRQSTWGGYRWEYAAGVTKTIRKDAPEYENSTV